VEVLVLDDLRRYFDGLLSQRSLDWFRLTYRLSTNSLVQDPLYILNGAAYKQSKDPKDLLYLIINFLNKVCSLFDSSCLKSSSNAFIIIHSFSRSQFSSVALIAYVLFWKIHYSILILSGSGDPWMSVNFQSTLINSTVSLPITEEPPGFFATLIEVHRQMYSAIGK